MMRNSIILFSMIILFFNCNFQEKESAFFLDYLKESRLIENAYYNGENISGHVHHRERDYFKDSILIKKFKHGHIRCELYKTDSLFSDTIYYIGIVFPPILPYSGYIILFDKNGKYLEQKEVSGKYHLDINFKSIDGHPKVFLMVNYGDGGVGTFHDIMDIHTISNNNIISLYEYDIKYESWYDDSYIINDSLISFSYQSESNQIMKINQITKESELNASTKQYQDTTIIESNILLIK